MSVSIASRRLTSVALTCVAIALGAACAPRSRAADAPAPELWLYYGSDLAKDGELERMTAIWARAAAAGYSRVILTDPKFERLGEMDARFLDRCKRAKHVADSLGLKLVPALFPMGRSNTLLYHDPNLAEALPVRDATLEVKGGVARIVADPPVSLGARPDFTDPPVAVNGGIATIRDNGARARFAFHVPVARFRCYHLSVEIRSDGYSDSPTITVLGGSQALTFTRSLGIGRTQDWTRVDLVFDSLDHDALVIWMGAWKPGRGTLEFRNWAIEEAGPVNVVRRPGAPFTIEGKVEGRDYEPVSDPKLGTVPWQGQYEAWHEAPPIRTKLPDGTRLRASWYYAAVLFKSQVTACPSEPGTLALLRDEAQRMKALWGADGYMMMHDEIRVMGWDESCRARGNTAGKILAANARDCVQLLAGSRVYVWGDMFDPRQNAVNDFYLVNGDLAGSWEGLDSSVVIVNWDAEHAAESLRFFAGRGHHQVIAGYYDGAPREVKGWIDAARGVPSVEGIMYTTWRNRYDDLEAFAREVKADWPR